MSRFVPNRAALLAAEAGAALGVAGVALRDTTGWLLVAGGTLAVVAAVLFAGLPAVQARARSAAAGATVEPGDECVASAVSRTSGEIGVSVDGQGCAAGVEVTATGSIRIDIDDLVTFAAADPCRPAGVQILIRNVLAGGFAPDAGYQHAAAGVPLGRRFLVLMRFEPARDPDVVAAHGGGADGMFAAVVASVDRLVAHLHAQRYDVSALAPSALRALADEDGARGGVTRATGISADSADSVAAALAATVTAPARRSALSLCADVGGGTARRYAVASVTADTDALARSALEHVAAHSRAVFAGAEPAAVSAAGVFGGGPRSLTAAVAR